MQGEQGSIQAQLSQQVGGVEPNLSFFFVLCLCRGVCLVCFLCCGEASSGDVLLCKHGTRCNTARERMLSCSGTVGFCVLSHHHVHSAPCTIALVPHA